MGEKRSTGFYVLTAIFIAFLVFLYGPVITIGILSFQGPTGGLTFPMQGTSLHWFQELFRTQMVGDIWGSFQRSIILGLTVMVITVVFSVGAGMAYRKKFFGSTPLFYLIIASLVIPSILVSLGVGLIFSQLGWEVHWSTSGIKMNAKSSCESELYAGGENITDAIFLRNYLIDQGYDIPPVTVYQDNQAAIL